MFHIYDNDGVCARCGFNSIAFRKEVEDKRDEPSGNAETQRKRELLGHVAEIPPYDAYDVMQAAYERTTTTPF